jgi:hypothetical protein
VFPRPIIEYIQEGWCEWSHPKVTGHMGVEYNRLGEECESRKASHKRGIPYGLEREVLGVSQGFVQEREKKELGVGATMEGGLWSVTRANWSWRTKEPGCHI